jgi:hypothetical protein
MSAQCLRAGLSAFFKIRKLEAILSLPTPSAPRRIPRARANAIRERNLAPTRTLPPFTVAFYVMTPFCYKTAQFCVTRRESERAETPSVGNGAQTDENPRKKSLLN